ncbi:glycosyl transferase [Vibrio sp. MACH09]|uniref:glycosyltransferase n=1 Tax=Vibrio sp. MACH09 TaxID=3025122 RepID=UPI0027949FBA|nr:glycosyltransferase [Vibrio sp. MACH09]GLO59643.1 glycosyl transferase [Vibrio sp. MACH09]
MKILQVMVHGSAHGYAGGTQKVMVELGNNLSKRGHEVTTIYNDTKAGELFFAADHDAKIVNLSTEIKGPFHHVYKLLRELTRPLRENKLAPYFPDPVHREKAKRLATPVGKFIEQFQPEIIFAYGIQDLNSIVWGHGADTPIIHMTHSDVNVYYQGLSFFDRRRIQKCAAVQALLPEFANTLGELLNIDVVSIPNIVTPPTQFVNLGINKSRKRIMMHSRLDKKKQQHMLLEAFALIKDEFPDWDVAIFGGESTKNYTKKLQSIIAEHQMNNRVSLSPPTSNVENELCKSDIFAFPSIHEEGWGLVLTEAMSVGLPCIGIKNTKAINYLITTENAGLVCNNDIVEFAQQLRTLMADTTLRQTYGNNAKLGMKKYYSKSVCEQWEALMEKMVNHH